MRISFSLIAKEPQTAALLHTSPLNSRLIFQPLIEQFHLSVLQTVPTNVAQTKLKLLAKEDFSTLGHGPKQKPRSHPYNLFPNFPHHVYHQILPILLPKPRPIPRLFTTSTVITAADNGQIIKDLE